MGSSAGPYQMEREAGAPFGVFNLAKFRAEVRSRVSVARAGEESGMYMSTSAYDSPPRTSTAYSKGSRSADRVAVENRLMSRDGDEAYEKLQRRAESTLAHAHFPPMDSKGGSATRRSASSLDVVRAPRSFAFLAPDPLKPDNLRWTQPQKWYALTPHSAQNRSNISEVRNQTMRPAMATMPSQSPFSAPPSRINKFSDISPNPRLIDGKKKKKASDDLQKASKVGIAKHGHMRKCQDPFTQGWQIATFKPAREKMVPYIAEMKHWDEGAGYGSIDLDGLDVFVHHSEVKMGQDRPLKKGDRVRFQLQSGLTGRRGIPEALNVARDDGLEHVPEGMSDEVYADLQSRRKLDEDLRPMFDTGFWKYPGSEETLPVQEGGLEDDELQYKRGIYKHTRNYTAYEQSVSFQRKMVMVNPNSDEQAAKVRPPDLKLNDNGPDVSAKFERKRWLEKFLTKSSSRHPLPRPGLESYYTSAVVDATQTDALHERARAARKTLHENAALSPTKMRLQMNPAPSPPVPVRNAELLQSRSSYSGGSSFDLP